MQIILTVSSIKPVVDMVEVDLGQDVPVDRCSVLNRINGMINEAFDCFHPSDDMVETIQRMLEDNELDDDELLFVAPEVYLFKCLLEELEIHPLTQQKKLSLRYVSVVGVFGDFMLHYK
jgi:hypothetical protein